MAIKEFEIGPQNYFEDGFFDGVYVERQNQSFATLTCEADRTVGFEFQAGFYFEQGFIEEGAFGVNSIIFTLTAEAMVVQEAEVSLGSYMVEGYYQTDYFQQRGSFFTLTAELERFGIVAEATALLESQFTQIVDSNKLLDAAADLNSVAEQTTINSRIVQAQCDFQALFEPNFTANAVTNTFAVLDSTAALATVATANRSADIALASMVNLSLQGDRLRSVTAALESTFTTQALLTKLEDLSAELSCEFTQSSQVRKLSGLTSNLSNNFNISCNARKIEGLRLSAFSNATLTATFNVLTDPTVYLFHFNEIATNQVPQAFYNRTFPKTGIISTGGYSSINTPSGRTFPGRYSYGLSDFAFDPFYFGPMTIALPSPYNNIGNQDFTIECWADLPDFNNTWEDPIMVGSGYSITTTGTALIRFKVGSNTFATSSGGNFGWNHVALSRQNGILRAFVDGVLIGSISNANTGTTISHSYGGKSSNGSGSHIDAIDEVRFTLGLSRYNSNFTPLIARIGVFPNIGFPYPGIKYYDSSLKSNFTSNIQGDKVKFADANLTAISSINVLSGKITNATIEATSITNFTVNSRVSYDPTINIKSSNFQIQITAGKTASNLAEFNSDFVLLCSNIRRTRRSLVELGSITNLTIDFNKVSESVIAISSNTTLTAQPYDFAKAEVSLVSDTALTAEPYDFAKSSADIVSEATVSCDNLRVRFADAELPSIATKVTVSIRRRSDVADLDSAFTLTASAQTVSTFEVDTAAEFTQTSLAVKTTATGADLVATTLLTADEDKIAGNNATLISEFSQQVDYERFRTTSSQQQVATELTAVPVKITSSDIALDCESTLTVDLARIRTSSSEMSANFTDTFTAVKTVNPPIDFASIATKLVVGNVIAFDSELTLIVNKEFRTLSLQEEPLILMVEPETRVNMVRKIAK